MRRVIEFGQTHPLFVILLIIAGSALSIIFLPNIWIDSSSESLMMVMDPDLDYYNETIKIFGSDTLMIVYVKDKNLFTARKLAVLDKLVAKLGNDEFVPGVQRIESLYSVNNLKNEAGEIDNSPLMEYPPESDAEAKSIMEKALENPILVHNLISADGTATVINMYLKASERNDRDAAAATAKGVNNVIKSKLDETDPASNTYTDEFDRIFEIGSPYVRNTLTSLIMSDMGSFIPLSIVVLMIRLIITMGSINGAILPLLTSSISILFTLGFMGAFNLPFNILTFIISILVIVIGSTEDVHILSEYTEGLNREGSRKLAIKFMARTIGTSVFLTAVTTFLGFLSIAINRVTVLVQFGLIAGFALLVNPLITFLLSPVYLRFFGKKTPDKREKKVSFLTRVMNKITGILLGVINKYKKIVVITFIAGALVIGLFFIFINIDNDYIGYFKKDSELIQRMQTMHIELSGTPTFFIRISFKKQEENRDADEYIAIGETSADDSLDEDPLLIIDDSSYSAEPVNEDVESGYGIPGEPGKVFQNPKYMQLLNDIQLKLDKDYEFDKTISIADYIRLVHKEFNAGLRGDFDTIPDPDDPSSPFLIAQYAQLLTYDEISSYITSDWSEANIIVRHNITSSDAIGRVIKKLDKDLNEILGKCDPDLSFKITGENILYNKAADSIAASQVSSLGLLLLIILIIMSILFTNIKAGLLALIPNILPVAILFGVMGIFSIPLNIGTCMVAAVAIGISVDDTIHFMTRFNREMRELQDKNKAVEAVIHSELKPIMSTSIALALGFFILSLSSLVPIIYFGILTAVVMICALLADLLITPVLLTSFQVINITDITNLKLANELKTAPLFKGMSMYQIKKFTLMGKVVKRETGDYVIKEGDTDQKMYILLSGKVKVHRVDPEINKTLFLDTFGVGDVFGEISLLRKAPRSANIVALEPVSYLEIDWEGLKRIRKSSRSISLVLYLNLSRILSTRLVHTTDMLEKSKLYCQ
ncbi:MAG: MMPL family transporter [Spirochaetales bacterium]|nr:MMPL family transporter [Spirochaetales bacterium]